MKILNTKSLMVITIVFSSVFAMPMVAFGQENDNPFNFDQVDEGIFEAFTGGFSTLFGQHLGYGGRILGSIFEALFLKDLNLSKYEILGSTLVLSANRTFRERGTYNFDDELDTRDIYIVPQGYVNMPETQAITTNSSDQLGHAYCKVEKHGEFDYEIEVGAAVTLIIWDSDRSFITAINRLLSFFRRIFMEGFSFNRDLIREGISLITWFLIHINDIFTGDELFIMNPITWKKLDIIPSTEMGKEFSITKELYFTLNDSDPLNDKPIESSPIDIPNGDLLLDFWNLTAQNRNDNYMQWLLTPTHGQVAETFWTQFSFDLIQLWIKNFEIHIDVGAILNAATGGGIETPETIIANAFEGCNIDFYLFTHHLVGAFLYNDTDSSQDISAVYRPVNISSVDGTQTVNIPVSTELTHRLILGQVLGGFNFEKPHIDPSNKSISWGIDILNPEISAVPLGVDLNSYLDAPKEDLAYIHFGFTFEPKVDNELGAAHGLVKLNQFFAPWNTPNGYYAKSPILGLDLAIIYVSTVLHFELDITTQDDIPEEPTAILEERHYNSTSHKLMVGDYIGAAGRDELEFVDIAGPDYEYGNESTPIRQSAPASTSIIPLAVWLMEHERHDTYLIEGGEEVSTFASDIRIQTELSVMVYAVCYPQFEDGSGIWHDPTFSVYMVFQSEGFWALIVLVAGVGLVGVATILIKRRKDRRF